MRPGDYLLCLFGEDFEVDHTFKAWPLHLTLVAWFRPKDDQFEQAITQLVSRYQPLSLQATLEGQHFGHQPGKLATLVVQDPKLMDLQRTLHHYLQSAGAWLVDDTTRLQRAFIPHITEQGSTTLRDGDRFVCNHVYMVEQLGGVKRIRAAIPLGMPMRRTTQQMTRLAG